MSNFQNLIRWQAEIKFGVHNEAAIAKWVGYWEETASRNRELLATFRRWTKIVFRGKTVLDVGCGTAGLSRTVTEENGFYLGLDFYPAILEMAHAFISDLKNPSAAGLIRGTAMQLPLEDCSADIVVACDVIEHLVQGESWQQQFLKEARRILRPNGLLLLTTPNRLHPFEGHTFMYGPQYLPTFLPDRYIRWKNPSFLQEYKTYGEVHLLTPWKMRRLLKMAGLRLIHDYPWGMDLEDYVPWKRVILRALGGVGLGWALPSNYWISACRLENWERVRCLRVSNGNTVRRAGG
jgi:ubiquinone/menaquinone biosynthesis C-methylase UbiE